MTSAAQDADKIAAPEHLEIVVRELEEKVEDEKEQEQKQQEETPRRGVLKKYWRQLLATFVVVVVVVLAVMWFTLPVHYFILSISLSIMVLTGCGFCVSICKDGISEPSCSCNRCCGCC